MLAHPGFPIRSGRSPHRRAGCASRRRDRAYDQLGAHVFSHRVADLCGCVAAMRAAATRLGETAMLLQNLPADAYRAVDPSPCAGGRAGGLRDSTAEAEPSRFKSQERRALRHDHQTASHAGFSSDLTVPHDARERQSRCVARDRYLLFVGTAEPRKGLDTLLDAMAEPALRGESLVVVGPRGWGGVDVAQEATARGIEDRVTVTGRVDDADLAALYAGATLLVMPSRAEGFGLPVLEAMTLGVPAVTSDDPAMSELGAGATQTFPVGDSPALCTAIVRVLNDAELRTQMVEAGRVRAQDFSWLDAARTLWGLYGQLVQ